jgi:endo-1,4-beta-mannosidase
MFGKVLLSSLLSSSFSKPWIENSGTWVKGDEWMVGSNFVPSTAVNELQMFQSESYDAETIDRELGYAESLGFNSMRVFLHNLLWEDSSSLLNTLESFLESAAKHKIGIMFVLLDSCWYAYPELGPQPEPIPYVHNSRWVQAPGIDTIKDASKFDTLKPYITGVVSHFRNDSRVIAW